MCTIVGWQTTMHPLFERYDVDSCGTINNKDDLSQMSLNAVVKFGLRLDMKVAHRTFARVHI